MSADNMTGWPGEPAQLRLVPRGCGARPSEALLEVELDLGMHEAWRRMEVLRAFGPDWDPIAVMQGEEEAYGLLYSGLDQEQQAVYDRLVQAGVLPRRGDGRDAA
jgi:Family of unknown function (DUF6400)